MTRHVRRLSAAAAFLALVPAWAYAQQQGTITGHVFDAGTKQPVPAVQVSVLGTFRGGVTDEKGEYTIRALTPGTFKVRAQRIGYQPEEQSVTVTAGGVATADFSLNQRAVSLDVTVVTASGETQRVRESGVLTGRLQVDSLNLAPVGNANEMLQSRVAGVSVLQASGTAGSSAIIRIRGSNSLSLSNDPLIIIDGVRVNNNLGDDANGNNGTIGVGGQTPTRLNDIDPQDIANIEVVKGPAAASLFGTAASNGVIYITTKKGSQGPGRWQLHAEGGSVNRETVFPANYDGIQVADGDTAFFCTNDIVAQGGCTQTGVLSWNPLEQATPFHTGNTQNYGLSVSGGTDRATYYVSSNWNREDGLLPWNTFRHYDIRANTNMQPRDNMSLTASVGYVQSRLRLPQNDNNVLGVLGGGLLGNFQDVDGRGYLIGQTPQQIAAINTQQNTERFTGSVNANWQVAHWLSLVGTTGLDFSDEVNQELIPPNAVDFADLPLGQRTSNPFQTFLYTMQGGATATFDLTSDIKSTTSAGVQYVNETVRGTEAFGKTLLPGTGSLAGASAQFAAGEQNTENITLGAYGQEQLAWRDRVFLNLAMRGDKNSAFGLNFKEVYYPSASLSYVIGEEPWFPKSHAFSSLRLRAAYGESGNHPNFRDAVTYYTPTAVRTVSGETPAFTVGGVANTDLKPEKSKEFEGGFDVGLLDERASLSFTYYNKTTHDALIDAPLAPSQGESLNIWRNLGELRNTGVEALLNANVLNQQDVKWDIGVNLSHNSNKIVNLGKDITPIIFNGGDQEHVNGYPAGGYWQRPILSYSDANHDGLLSPDEIAVGDTAVYLGNPFPSLEMGFNTSITVFRHFRINGLIDYRGGQKLLNLTERFRCAFEVCQAENDPHASLASQAASIGVLYYGTDAGYVEDASFWKLRELSLTMIAPESWAHNIGASNLSITFAGRNLHTWTKYKGFDPELNFSGGGNFTITDFLTMPPSRYYTVRMDVTW